MFACAIGNNSTTVGCKEQLELVQPLISQKQRTLEALTFTHVVQRFHPHGLANEERRRSSSSPEERAILITRLHHPQYLAGDCKAKHRDILKRDMIP